MQNRKINIFYVIVIAHLDDWGRPGTLAFYYLNPRWTSHCHQSSRTAGHIINKGSIGQSKCFNELFECDGSAAFCEVRSLCGGGWKSNSFGNGIRCVLPCMSGTSYERQNTKPLKLINNQSAGDASRAYFLKPGISAEAAKFLSR